MARKLKWTISRYNRFLKAARNRYGINQAQARELYRKGSSKLQRSPSFRDLTNHPKIFSTLNRAITAGPTGGPGGRRKSEASVVRAKGKGPSAIHGGAGVSGGDFSTTGSGGGSSASGKINSVAAWDEFIEDYIDDLDTYDYIEYESSADYGEE